MFFLVSCQDEFVIGPNSCLHAVIDIIDPVKQVHLGSFFLRFLFGMVSLMSLICLRSFRKPYVSSAL